MVCAMLFAFSGSAEAQQPGKIFRIGFLHSGTASGSADLLDAFRQQLSKLGWLEGKNVTLEYRFAEQRSESLADLAAELVKRNVDLLVVSGGTTPAAAKRATTTIPIVMTNSADPVAEGVVASLARPRGNVTGNATLSPGLNTKRLEVLKDTVSRLDRVGLLRLPGKIVGQDAQLNELRPAAQALKLQLEEIETEPDARHLENAFQTATQKHVKAIMTTTTRPFLEERKQMVELAVRYGLPAIYFQKGFVDEGGLMFYGIDFADLYRRAAVYVDKILKGAKPADLPVKQPTKFELIINLKAANQIGVTIPPNVLARADRVIR